MKTICPIVGRQCVVTTIKENPRGIETDCIFFDRLEFEKGGTTYSQLHGYCILRKYVHDVLIPQMNSMR